MTFYPEKNEPRHDDEMGRSLHKINDLLHGIGIPAHDYVAMSPAAKPTTITYKSGGASGLTVAILTLTYDGDNVSSVTRS